MEEMPPFTEKESSILAVLKKKSGRMSAQEAQREARVQAREGNAAPLAEAQAAQVNVPQLLFFIIIFVYSKGSNRRERGRKPKKPTKKIPRK